MGAGGRFSEGVPMKRILASLLGVAVTLAWWTIRGSHAPAEQIVNTIPTKVWDGGGGTIAIDVDANVDATLSIGFSERRDGGQRMTTLEKVGPGPHSWTIEVPRNAGGYIEFEADAPQPGAKMSWTLRHDGRRIASAAETLDQPLGKNEAFFLQEYYEDYSKPDARVSAATDDDD